MKAKDEKILVTGGTGLIGTNLVNRLENDGYEVLAVGSENDLRDEDTCNRVFKSFKPKVVFHLAAKVGGIYANSNFKSEFYSDNVLINTHVVNACVNFNVKYIFAMGTGCAYPKRLENNILYESDFLDGVPESTNDAYAYAKRGLLVHLQALNEANILKYVYSLPANIYGPFDNFHPMHSHVIPGLIRRFYDCVLEEKREIPIWGDGSACRDFMFIDDCIDAMMLLFKLNCEGVYNIATGKLTSISSLAQYIKDHTGFNGNIIFDEKKPAGQMQRKPDISKMEKIGWTYKISLEEGLKHTIKWFKKNRKIIRER